MTKYNMELTTEIKQFLRDQKYVNICMREACNKKCRDEFCRQHGMHKCAREGCDRNVINKQKEFCGIHTPEARAKNNARIKKARADAKKYNEMQKLIAAGID